MPPLAREALELARRGDTAGAIAAARDAVASAPDDYGLRLFIGMLHSRRLELDEALPHVRRAVALAPSDPVPRIELIRLLIGLGRLDEAERLLGEAQLPGLEPHRLQAMIHARRDQPGLAAQLFQQIVAADPADYESWGSLGACFLARAQPRRAAGAFARALQLRPDMQKFRDKLMEAQVDAGQGEEALAAARRFAHENPGKAEAHVTVAQLEKLLDRPESAVGALREALAVSPDHLPALVTLAALLERLNAIDEFADTIGRIERLDPNAADLPLLRARLALRKGDPAKALELAESAPRDSDRGNREQLIGTIHDRLGNSEAAFAAFEEMNRVRDLADAAVGKQAQALRDRVDHRARITTAEWVRGWSSTGQQPEFRQPTFLIGFPRSGTTLLDTFLMGHPDICIAEERPMLQAVGDKLGDYERLATLDESELRSLRELYFATAAEHVPGRGDRLLVDKVPFGAIDAALIHRLFPAARIIFAERHPCDVVLSCFFTRFQPTTMLTSFYSLEDAARLYDRVMNLWERSRAAMPLEVHPIRYEALVADAESEMRRLILFLGLDWDERVIDHKSSAQGRSFVASASYAQVVEPLYDRSVGRWKRYRKQLEQVLPLLEPWASKMGYEI